LSRPDEFAFVQFEFDAAYQQPLENSHTGPQLHRCIRDGQMAASDYMPIYLKNRIFRNAPNIRNGERPMATSQALRNLLIQCWEPSVEMIEKFSTTN
jgi:hypothetical protein